MGLILILINTSVIFLEEASGGIATGMVKNIANICFQYSTCYDSFIGGDKSITRIIHRKKGSNQGKLEFKETHIFFSNQFDS